MKRWCVHVLLVTMAVIIATISAAAPADGGPLAEQCSKDFQKVMLCLDFASGKAPKPSKQCCEAVEDIKEKEPKCLCYVIQQAQKGGDALKDLGVQESKLTELPSACQIQNASIANCPALLGISPSSPDAAAFTSNATSSTTTPTGPGGKSPASPSTSEKGGSASIRDGHAVVALTVALIAVSFISTLPWMGLEI